jgi:hypothetical protein
VGRREVCECHFWFVEQSERLHVCLHEKTKNQRRVRHLRVIESFYDRLTLRIEPSLGRSIRQPLIIPSPIHRPGWYARVSVHDSRIPARDHGQGPQQETRAEDPSQLNGEGHAVEDLLVPNETRDEKDQGEGDEDVDGPVGTAHPQKSRPSFATSAHHLATRWIHIRFVVILRRLGQDGQIPHAVRSDATAHDGREGIKCIDLRPTTTA